PALPAGVGHDDLVVRGAAEPLREVLLRRPGEDAGGPLPGLRRRAGGRARRRVPAARRRAARGADGRGGGRLTVPLTPPNPRPPFDVVRVAPLELGAAHPERSLELYQGALGKGA